MRRINVKISEIKKCLNLLKDNDEAVFFGYAWVEFLVDGVYRTTLYYNYATKEVEKLESIREKLREAVPRLKRLKEEVERETGLKFEVKKLPPSNFEFVYYADLPYMLYYGKYGIYVTKVGLSMASDMEKFRVVFEGWEVIPFRDCSKPYSKKRTTVRYFKKEKDVLEFFRDIINETPEIYRELSKTGLSVRPVFSYSSDCIWHYRIEIGDKALGICPDYHFYQDSEYKGKISKEEWDKILSEALKIALIDKL